MKNSQVKSVHGIKSIKNRDSKQFVLREACDFCRSRKIRCSGESICGACREKNIDCVYETETRKGRPKRKLGIWKQNGDRSDDISAIEQSRAQGENGNMGGAMGIPSVTIAEKLSEMFKDFFEDSIKTSEYPGIQNSIAMFNQHLKENPDQDFFAIGNMDLQRRTSYDGLVCFLAGEMIEMVSNRFGSLGCEGQCSESYRFYVASLVRDQTTGMFDTDFSVPNPIKSIGQQRLLQLIDVWFNVHPLSPILSKTLLLGSFNDGSYDEILMSIVLADACHAQKHSNQTGGDDEEETAFFRYATSRLGSRMTSERTLSIVQAILLLGWRELCTGNARRGTCYIGYALRIAMELKDAAQREELVNRKRLNGIDVAEVEKELVRNMFWVGFSICTWSFMQMGQPIKTCHTEPPPFDESSSAAIQLDLSSDNVSTLQAQARTIRQLSTLSHIASTTANIWGLYPTAEAEDESKDTSTWQARHLSQLRSLLTFRPRISGLCNNIRQILTEAVKDVERDASQGCAQSIVRIAYHTISIHLLFPKSSSDDEGVTITPTLLDDILKSTMALLAVYRASTMSQLNGFLLVNNEAEIRVTMNALVVSLDACGRAFSYIFHRAQMGSSNERQAIVAKRRDIMTAVRELREVSRSDQARQTSIISPVKKRLKQAMVAFESLTMSPVPTPMHHQNLMAHTPPSRTSSDSAIPVRGSVARSSASSVGTDTLLSNPGLSDTYSASERFSEITMTTDSSLNTDMNMTPPCSVRSMRNIEPNDTTIILPQGSNFQYSAGLPEFSPAVHMDGKDMHMNPFGLGMLSLDTQDVNMGDLKTDRTGSDSGLRFSDADLSLTTYWPGVVDHGLSPPSQAFFPGSPGSASLWDPSLFYDGMNGPTGTIGNDKAER